tara:strand:- start:178 stop:396 length:219 start_codon:yes stop_codon:yes gene_type:complete
MDIKNLNFNNVLLIICLVVMIFIFSLISFNLRPLARWANYQTICIEEESIDTNIPWAVRKCNGRSKVYQVKE